MFCFSLTKRWYFFFPLLFLISCNFFKDSRKDKGGKLLLAQVQDKRLSYSQLPLYLKEFSGTDSTVFFKYRKQWIKRQLIQKEAVKNIETDSEIENKVEEYREALLVAKFKKAYLKKNIDTVITSKQLKAFYNADSSLFFTNEDLIKATFIKVASNVPELERVQELVQKNDTFKLHSFAVRFAKKFFINKWVRASEIFQEPSFHFSTKKEYIAPGKLIVKADAENTCILMVAKTVKAGNLAPLEFKKEEVENLILNKRKTDLLKKMEEHLFNEAKKRGEFEIY